MMYNLIMIKTTAK